MNKYVLTLIIIILAIFTTYSTYNYYETVENTVFIGYLPSNHHAALFVAQEKNLFEKEGLNVQLVPFRNGEDLLRAAEYNQIDMGYCGITPVMMALDENEPIKVVAAVNQEGSGIVVSNDIRNVNDFKGETVAIPREGSIQDVLLKYYLLKNNINPDEVNITELEVPVMKVNLENQFINAYVAWEPYVSLANMSNENVSRTFIYSGDIIKDHPCCVVIATDKFIESKPNSLRKVLKVHVNATEYVKDHTEEVAQILSAKLGTDVEVEKEGLKHVEFIAVPSQEFMEETLIIHGIQKELGYVKNDITLEEIFDLRYLP